MLHQHDDLFAVCTHGQLDHRGLARQLDRCEHLRRIGLRQVQSAVIGGGDAEARVRAQRQRLNRAGHGHRRAHFAAACIGHHSLAAGAVQEVPAIGRLGPNAAIRHQFPAR